MRRRLSGIVAAAVLATLGTTLLVAYVQSARSEAVAGEELVPVLVVKKPIVKGAAALADAVSKEQVPAKVRAEGAVEDLSALKDLVASVDLVAGEQIVASRFVRADTLRKSVVVPPDKLEVTVSLEPARALGGEIRPGDTVGVVMSEKPFSAEGADGNFTPFVSRMVLHKVLVTRVALGQAPAKRADDKKDGEAKDGKEAEKAAKEPTVAPTGELLVTLALDAHAVERVVFVAEYGSLWLANEPSTASEAGSKPTTFGELFQ